MGGDGVECLKKSLKKIGRREESWQALHFRACLIGMLGIISTNLRYSQHNHPGEVANVHQPQDEK